MTKFSNKLKKLCFWPVLGPFSQFLGQKNFFPKNPALSCTTSYGILPPSQNLEEIISILRKRLGRRKDGRTDGRMDRRTDGRTDRQTDPIL